MIAFEYESVVFTAESVYHLPCSNCTSMNLWCVLPKVCIIYPVQIIQKDPCQLFWLLALKFEYNGNLSVNLPAYQFGRNHKLVCVTLEIHSICFAAIYYCYFCRQFWSLSCVADLSYCCMTSLSWLD